jgi:hypothetical protein
VDVMCGWHRRNVCAGSGGAGEAIEIDGGWQWHVRGWAGLAEKEGSKRLVPTNQQEICTAHRSHS